MLKIEEITHVSQLATIREEWQSLAEAAGGDLYQSYEWISTWLRLFWQDRPLFFLLARKNGVLVGLVPFLKDDNGEAWCRRSLPVPIHTHIQRTDVLCADDHEAFFDAVLTHLAGSGQRFKLGLHLQVDSTTFSTLPLVAQNHGMHTLVRPDADSPVIVLDNNTNWDQYLASKSRHFRKELRRKTRKIEKEGRVEWVVRNGQPGELDSTMADILQIERNSWKVEEGESIAGDLTLEQFYSEIAREFANRGWLRIYLLYFNGMPICHIYGVVHGNQYYALKTSYDQSFRRYAPGAVLFGHALRDLFEQGLRGFDFLGGEGHWKDDWANTFLPHAYLCVVSHKGIGCQSCHLYHTQLRPMIKKHFPVAATRLKRALRQKGILKGL